MNTIRKHTDLSLPIILKCHEERIEIIIQTICEAFPKLFSDPEKVKTSRQQYIVSATSELRRQHRIIEQDKLRQKRRQEIVKDPTHGPPGPHDRLVDGCADVAMHDKAATHDVPSPVNLEDHPRNFQEVTIAEAIAVEALSASPPFRSIWRLLFSPSRPKGNLSHAVPAHSDFVEELDYEDKAMPPYIISAMEHEEVHDFLASCKPSLTHLYPYLVAYGCTDLDYLQVMFELPDSDLQVVLESMKVVEGVLEAKPVKPMDWVVLKHFIRKLRAQ
ncbi:hypothetical protein BDN72DRAFT_848980 [Pluteus cervinus]|uniref:Uncharacterized protein n=1 Tax=Pluteus cervinus TaxID=181527 RepID=A0ACD3A959_9AGAR|nr:hypothetical protein BDN72DRAFT_848980 [Pluteus cervinus]